MIHEWVRECLRISAVSWSKSSRRLPFPLNSKSHGVVLISLLLLLSHRLQGLELDLLKCQKGYHGRAEQLQDFVDVLDLFAHGAVTSAECAHAHFFCKRFPAIQHCADVDIVLGIGTVESKGLDVVEYQIALSELIEHELNYLRPILLVPEVGHFHNRLV